MEANEEGGGGVGVAARACCFVLYGCPYIGGERRACAVLPSIRSGWAKIRSMCSNFGALSVKKRVCFESPLVMHVWPVGRTQRHDSRMIKAFSRLDDASEQP